MGCDQVIDKMFNFDGCLLTDFGYTCKYLLTHHYQARSAWPTSSQEKKHANFVDFGKMQWIYIIIMPFLLKNGPNSSKVEKVIFYL